MVPTVKLFLPLLLTGTLFMAGCQSNKFQPIDLPLFHGFQTWSQSKTRVAGSKYTELTVTDMQGELVATWVAEGEVRPYQDGYLIKAVERRLPPPENLDLQYPNGRAATVVGVNIILQKVPKPLWLAELDGDVKPVTATSDRSAVKR